MINQGYLQDVLAQYKKRSRNFSGKMRNINGKLLSGFKTIGMPMQTTLLKCLINH